MARNRSLEDLPDEILLNIASHLVLNHRSQDPVSDQHKALLALNQTCKRFNHLTKRLLVYSFSNLYDIASPLPFLKHLIANPSIKRDVKQLYLRVEKYDNYPAIGENGELDDPAFYDSLSAEDSAIIMPHFYALDPRLSGLLGWGEMVRTGGEDAVNALLIASTHSLETLEMVEGYCDGESYVRKLLWHTLKITGHHPLQHGNTPVNNRTLPFMNLRRVYLEWADTEDGLGSANLIPFFHLPNLKELEGCKITCEDWDFADPTINATLPGAGTSPVETLILTMSDFTDDGVRGLVTACKELKTLVMEWGNSMVGSSTFTYTGISQALLCQRDSLLRLWIDGEQAFYAEAEDAGRLEDLPGLNVLRELVVNVKALYSDEESPEENEDDSSVAPLSTRLPRSIERLGLFLDMDVTAWMRVVEEFIRDCGEGKAMERLKILDLRADFRQEPGVLDRAKELATSAGLELVLCEGEERFWSDKATTFLTSEAGDRMYSYGV